MLQDKFSHLFHESKDLKSLLDLKTAFEAFASKFGVTVQSNWADNAIYAADAFKSVCTAQKQDLTHCAVGGHWQNAIAENNRICDSDRQDYSLTCYGELAHDCYKGVLDICCPARLYFSQCVH
jgi:hypothetical protein